MELIKEAGLNTLLGMGMTFVVLISLSLIISLFGKILNGGFAKPAEKKAPQKQPEKKPEPAPEVTKEAPAQGALEPAQASGDDPEVMAVIAAAVAAYEEGDVSADTVAVISAAIAAYEAEEADGPAPLIPGVSGFAVRKIRKSRRHVA